MSSIPPQTSSVSTLPATQATDSGYTDRRRFRLHDWWLLAIKHTHLDVDPDVGRHFERASLGDPHRQRRRSRIHKPRQTRRASKLDCRYPLRPVVIVIVIIVVVVSSLTLATTVIDDGLVGDGFYRVGAGVALIVSDMPLGNQQR